MTKTQEGKTGIRWTFVTKLEDLDYTDVIALSSSTKSTLKIKLHVRQTGLSM